MSPAVAFLFPGQGSQAVGMGRALAHEFRVAADVFAEADDTLGVKLSSLCFDGPSEALTLTMNAQPAILTTSVAALRVLEQEVHLRPAWVAGHSLGEYSALVAAGALRFADAVRIVRERGRLMQEAVPAGIGSMAALFGLPEETVVEICEEEARDEVVAPANLNGGGQIVVAGHAAAVRRVVAAAKAKGAKRAVELEVSAPFHCALMAPAAEGLARVLEPVSVLPLGTGLVANATAQATRSAGRVKELLVRQVTAAVRWEESIRLLRTLGCEATAEIGPGRVLQGLQKRIEPTFPCASVSDGPTLATLKRTLL